MSQRLDLDDPIAVLLAAVEALRTAGIDCAVYGGLALAAYATPRETKDADLAVVGVSGAAAAAAKAISSAGVDSVALTFDRTTFGGLAIARVTLLGGAHQSGLNMVDLVEPRSKRYAETALRRAISASLRKTAVRVLCPEDFIIFKVLSTRARDLEDAAAVIEAVGEQIDLSLVASELQALSVEVQDHPVAARYDQVRLLLG